MTTFAAQAVGRPITEDMFADLGYPHVEFAPAGDGGVRVTVDADLTADQIARAKVRLMTADDNGEQILWAAYKAVSGNNDFLGLAAPTSGQAVAQVQALTRQMNKLIQHLLPDVT